MKKGKEVTETEWVRNITQREDFIKTKGGVDKDGNVIDYQKGYEAFMLISEVDKKWNKLRDIPIPEEYSWIWGHFLNIWNGCTYDFNGNVIFTFQTINEYVQCMKVPLSVEDKKELFRIRTWAVNVISELEKE